MDQINSLHRIPVDQDIYLRDILISDAPEIFKIIDTQREYLGRWLPFVKYTKRVGDTKAFINSVIHLSQDKQEYVYSIIFQKQLVGLINLRQISSMNKIVEIGYWISKEFQKKGIISKSVYAICNHALEELNYNRIQIKCAVDNWPSKKIPQRLNFKLEGIERDGQLMADDTYVDLEIFSLLKKDFK